jgi:hypothetical protein
MIKRYLMLSFVLLGLSSCESAVRPSFEIMSEPELAMYNASLSIDEQVICREEIEGWRIFSGAISFREEIKGSQGGPTRRWNLRHSRMQPKLCLSVRELKVLKRRAERGFGTVGGAGYGNSIGGDYQPADAADYHSGAFNGGHND